MSLLYTDTHAHLSDEAFSADAEAVLFRAAEAGVKLIIHPDIDSSERPRTLEMCRRHAGVMFPMVGLYPGSVGKEWEKEIEKVEESLAEDIVAIGEIGLDYHWSTEFTAEQKLAFRYQLELADRLNLPVNIHLRDATDDFFAVMDSCRHLKNLRGNIHAFSGSYETFRRLGRYGDWKVGIGGVVTYKNSHLAVAVKDIPLKSILLETDSPYLPPVPYRGQRNEPAYIPVIAAKIAAIKGIDIEEVAAVTTENAINFFSLKLS